MEKYDRFTRQWGEWFNWVAITAIAVMLGVAVVDIVGSKLFRWPFPGSMDIIGLLGLLAAAFAIARAEIFKQHVRVDFLLTGLKERTQGMIGIVSNFLALTLIGLVIWRCVDYGIDMQASKASSPTLRIPSFPFSYAIALACIPLFLVLLLELFESIRKAGKK
jgi:TRAP-type C4-dicarboxylate transport system permease small subunit